MQATRQAFTLIELLAVIIILAILAGVAIPKYLDYQVEAKEASCKGTLGGVRAGIANHYANEAIVNGTAAYPTIAQLTTIGTVMQEAIPDNPYGGVPDPGAVATQAVFADALTGDAVGAVGGWAYYQGTGGNPSVFYANTNTVGENTF
jgi:prepilin-type N-terminal cleavage/methylation domain-containing protein